MNLEELKKVKEKALEDHIPIIMDDTLKVIEDIIKEIKPKKILEIGTAVGYSASQFIRFSNEEAKVDTIELDEDRAKQAKENFEKIGVSNNVNLIVGNAVEILPILKEKYDMIFIDANKGKYPVFLNDALELSHVGTVIIADNVLYKGYVLSDYNKHKQRTAVRHIREYLAEIVINENLESEVLKVGDGLAISTVKAISK